MAFTVTFNGVDLTALGLEVERGLERNIGTTRTVELEKRGRQRGKDFLYTTAEEKTITMPFRLNTNLVDKRRVLEAALNVDEPKKLIFSDEPDRYYLALPTGDIKVSETSFIGHGAIEWVVPDSLAHATVKKPFTGVVKDGVMTLTVENNGSVPVPIDYIIKHKKENGFIGIASPYGAMQFGSPQELDGYSYEKSVELLNTWDFKEFRPVTSGENPENPTKGIKTPLEVVEYADKGGRGEKQKVLAIKSNSFVQDPDHALTGGLWEWELPDDGGTTGKGATNWYCYFNFTFEAWAWGLTGSLGINFIGEDNTLVAAVIVDKPDASGNTARMFLEVGNGSNEAPRGYAFDRKDFAPTREPHENAFVWPGGHSDIIKEGDTLKFYWWGSYIPIVAPAIKDTKVVKVQLYLGQYSNQSSYWLNLISLMFFKRVRFVKNNTTFWHDNPNRYPAGSEVFIDGTKTAAYMGGKVLPDDEIKGTKYFMAPPGKTEIRVFCSEWSEFDSVKAEIAEAWG